MPIPSLLLATTVALTAGSSPPRAPAPVTSRATVTRALQLPWGGALGRAGHTEALQANFEGPKAFVVDERGAVYLLDQVNGRVQVFEHGAFVRALPLPGVTYDDLALDADGGLVVMDRLKGDTLDFLDPLGRLQRSVRLPGPGVPESGYVTALLARDDGFWVEYAARYLVRVADAQGRPDEARPLAAGRPGRKPGRAYRVRLAGPRAIELLVGPSTDRSRRLAPVARHSFPMTVHLVEGVETLPDGRLVVAVQQYEEGPGPQFAIVRQAVTLMTLDPDTGRELARAEVPASSAPEEALRRLRAGADGAVYYLEGHEAGVSLWRWTP